MSESESPVKSAGGNGPAATQTPNPRGGFPKVRLVAFAAFGAAAFVLGYWVAPRHTAEHASSPMREEKGQNIQRIRYWTCSMHPQIKAPREGKCPICFMDLVPVYAGSGTTDDVHLVLSETARELAEIETSPVEFRPLSVTVRMAGKIDYDETKLAYVSAWVPSRIDRLYVNYVGAPVAPSDHLAYVYSPDLRTAQEEYLIATRRWQAAQQSSDADETASAQSIRDATRKKLELWGILPAQIGQLEKTGQTDDHMTVYAPVGGTVIARDAFEGKYVQAGDRLFTIADLTALWALLDAYEIDLGWLRYGQTVEFETDAYPGEVFEGRIAFIQPVLNEMTRTIKVRVNVSNPDERLKPGMFLRAVVKATLNEAGRVMEADLAGKWICPMHPEIVKDAGATCDVCGMDLVETARLGFGRPGIPARKVLSIPWTAPLLTGTRAVVYIEETKDGQTTYAARQIELGPRAGDYYVVQSGLTEGQRVVTRGNFKIDAALQIQAKPSMMKPEENGYREQHEHGAPAAVPTTGSTPTEVFQDPMGAGEHQGHNSTQQGDDR